MHFASSRQRISVECSETVDSLGVVYHHAAFMSLVFSYKNLSAPRAPRSFNNSLGQQYLYFLPNKLHVNQIKPPGGSRYGANLGVEKLEQTQWLYVGSSNSKYCIDLLR